MLCNYNPKIGILDNKPVRTGTGACDIANAPIVGIDLMICPNSGKFTIIDPRGFCVIGTLQQIGHFLPYMLRHAVMDAGKIISPCVWLNAGYGNNYLPFPIDSDVCHSAIERHFLRTKVTPVSELSPGDQVTIIETGYLATYLGEFSTAYYSEVKDERYISYKLKVDTVHACITERGVIDVSVSGFPEGLYKTGKKNNVELSGRILSDIYTFRLCGITRNRTYAIMGGIIPGVRSVNSIEMIETTDIQDLLKSYGDYVGFANTIIGNSYACTNGDSRYYCVQNVANDLTSFQTVCMSSHVNPAAITHVSTPCVEWA